MCVRVRACVRMCVYVNTAHAFGEGKVMAACLLVCSHARTKMMMVSAHYADTSIYMYVEHKIHAEARSLEVCCAYILHYTALLLFTHAQI